MGISKITWQYLKNRHCISTANHTQESFSIQKKWNGRTHNKNRKLRQTRIILLITS